MSRTSRALPGAVLLALLLPAGALTAVRLLEPGAATAVRLASFTPLGLPLHLLALVLLLALAAARPRGHRRACWAGAAVALVGVVLHAWWVAPAFVGRGPEPAPGARPVVVMSANLFEGRADAAGLVDAVRRHDVDVLVLEEVSLTFVGEANSAGLRALLPFSISGPAGYDPVAGTMVLSRTPLSEPTAVETGHQSWLVDVAGPGGGADLRLLAVHPVAPIDVDAWRADHAVIAEAARTARPDVVAGDFNATADHQPLQRLADLGLHDVGDLADVGWQPTWPANGLGPVTPLLPPVVRIDHVLAGPGWAGLDTRTVEVAGTDHLALVARLAPAR